MSIIWKYLNKRSGAIDAIRDHDSMQFIIENTSEDIKQAYAAMTSLHPSGFDGMPHSSNPHAVEDHIISGLADIDNPEGTLPAGVGVHGMVSARMGETKQ